MADTRTPTKVFSGITPERFYQLKIAVRAYEIEVGQGNRGTVKYSNSVACIVVNFDYDPDKQQLKLDIQRKPSLLSYRKLWERLDPFLNPKTKK